MEQSEDPAPKSTFGEALQVAGHFPLNLKTVLVLGANIL